MVKNISLYDKALLLRKNGYSYNKIRLSLHIPKSTLSTWFSAKKWSNKLTDKLIQSNRIGNIAHIAQLAIMKKEQKIIRYANYCKEARDEYAYLKNNRLFLIGLSLYWGEGDKIENGRVSVINTDEKMLQIIHEFYKNILKIPEDKIRAALFLYKDIDISSCFQHWVSALQISKENFIKTQILPSRSTLTKRKTFYGMCSLYFSDTKTSIKLKEWIKLMFEDLRV